MRSPWQFSSTLWSENKDKDLQIIPRGSSRTTTLYRGELFCWLSVCRMLQLNGDKRELLWFSSATHFHRQGPSRWTPVSSSQWPSFVIWDWLRAVNARTRLAYCTNMFSTCAVCSSTTRQRCVCSTRLGPRTTCTTATLFLPVFQRQQWQHCWEPSQVSRRTTSPNERSILLHIILGLLSV